MSDRRAPHDYGSEPAPENGASSSATEDFSSAVRTLQALNEKLAADNDSLRTRLGELQRQMDAQGLDLQRSEQDFRLLADNVPALFSYLDAEQRYRYVNPRCAAIFARDRADMIGRRQQDVLSPQLYQTIQPQVEKALSGVEVHFEMAIPRDDGERVFQTTCMPDLDEQGRVSGLFMLASDITDRKIAERELHDEQQRLSTILKTAADAIVTVDRAGVIRDFNHAAARIFGYPDDEAMGMEIERLIPTKADDTEGFPRRYRLKSQPAETEGIHREAVGRRKDGSRVPIEMAVSEIDSLGLYVSLLRDISDRKELEQEVIEMSTLEQERFGREIHDGIGQQLTALGMLANGLEKRLVRAQRKEDAAAAGQLVIFIQQAMDEVKALSRGLMPVEIGQDGLADSLARLVEHAGVSSGIRCEFSHAGSIVTLDEMVAVHLYRIVQEAINNAIKHAKTDRIEVEVRQTRKRLSIRVRDNGAGIDPMNHRKGRLGLHIMRYRAGIIGAELEIVTQPGGGTLVRCDLPLGAAD